MKLRKKQFNFPSPKLGVSLKSLKKFFKVREKSVSVPLFGAISEIESTTKQGSVLTKSFRPLIWGYLLNRLLRKCIRAGTRSFRPLIWGYL